MNKFTKDIEMIRSIVAMAHQRRHSVAIEVADQLAHYRRQLRENRKWLRERRGYDRPAMTEYRVKDCRRILANAKRLRRLAKLFASFRGEHPAAAVPPARDCERKCEPSIAEMARRCEPAVYARVA